MPRSLSPLIPQFLARFLRRFMVVNLVNKDLNRE
jgi:hypothetical protein